MGSDGGTAPNRADLLRRASWKTSENDTSRSTRGGTVVMHQADPKAAAEHNEVSGDHRLPIFHHLSFKPRLCMHDGSIAHFPMKSWGTPSSFAAVSEGSTTRVPLSSTFASKSGTWRIGRCTKQNLVTSSHWKTFSRSVQLQILMFLSKQLMQHW